MGATTQRRAPDSGFARGVMQAPGRPEEDTEGGFKHGGWAIPYHAEELAASVVNSMAATDAISLVGKTFENFAANRAKGDPLHRTYSVAGSGQSAQTTMTGL